MANFIYGATTITVLVAMMDVIDRNVPNNIWYYIDLYAPF